MNFVKHIFGVLLLWHYKVICGWLWHSVNLVPLSSVRYQLLRGGIGQDMHPDSSLRL